MSQVATATLPPQKKAQLDHLAAALRSKPERLIVAGQVDERLVPYVKSALRNVSKTELVNAALAAFFEVQVCEETAR